MGEVIPAPLAAGKKIAVIIPETVDDVWRIAQAMHKSGLAPNGISKPEQLVVAIMHGLEIGLPPMQAIQRIAVINGRPSIWGEAIDGEAADGAAWVRFPIDCTHRDAHGFERVNLRALVFAELLPDDGKLRISIEEIAFDDYPAPRVFRVIDTAEPFLRQFADRLVDENMEQTAHEEVRKLLETTAHETRGAYSPRPWDGGDGPVINLTGVSVLRMKTQRSHLTLVSSEGV